MGCLKVIALTGLLVVVATVFSVSAQTPAPRPDTPSTMIESLLMTHGLMIAKDFYPQGELNGTVGGGSVDLDAMIVKAGTAAPVKGLRIEVKEGGRLERSNTSFLDLDELDDLAKALDYFSSSDSEVQPANLANTDPAPHRETTFSTRGSFRLTCFGQGGSRSCAVESGSVGGTRVFISGSQLVRLKTLVANARATVLK
jgi:hypothetical protein